MLYMLKKNQLNFMLVATNRIPPINRDHVNELNTVFAFKDTAV